MYAFLMELYARLIPYFQMDHLEPKLSSLLKHLEKGRQAAHPGKHPDILQVDAQSQETTNHSPINGFAALYYRKMEGSAIRYSFSSTF